MSLYFDSPGPENTQKVLQCAYERGKALGLTEVVIASSKGATALRALEVFQGFQITAVTYHCGFKAPFESVMDPAARAELEKKGVPVVQATHALSGLERSWAKKHGGAYPILIMADTLRLFGQGTKVAVEVAVMAADAGRLTGADILSIGGTGRGADTALILKPANQSDLFDLRIREIICKPRSF